jgi:hypothetical protein
MPGGGILAQLLAQTFTANGSSTAPAYLAGPPIAVCWGPAGTAAAGTAGTGGGGGGGPGLGAELALGGVAPGTVLTVTVPGLGAGTATTITGGSVTVTGNPGGNASVGTGGAAGTTSSNSTTFAGGLGGNGAAGGSGGGGGGGGSPGTTGAGGAGGAASGTTGGTAGAAGTGPAGPGASLAGAAGGAGGNIGTGGSPGSAPGAAGGGGAASHGAGAGQGGQAVIIYPLMVIIPAQPVRRPRGRGQAAGGAGSPTPAGPGTAYAQRPGTLPRGRVRGRARAAWQQLTGAPPCLQLVNSFEGGTSGTTISPANSGGASGNAFDTVSLTGTGVLAFDNAHAAHGSLSLKAQAVTSGDMAAANWISSLGMHTQLWFREYLYFTANPTANCRVFSYLAAAANCATVSVNSLGQLIMLSSNAVTMFTFATAIPLNQWFRIEGTVFNSAAAGQGTLRLYTAPDSVTPAETHTSAANFNTLGSGNSADFGIAFSAAVLGPYWIDDVGVSTCGFLGPAFALAPAQQSRPVLRRRPARALARFIPVTVSSVAPPPAGGGLQLAGADSDRPWLKRRRVKWYRHGAPLNSWYGADIPAGVGSAYEAGRGLAGYGPDDADTALPREDTVSAEVPDAGQRADSRVRRRANLGERIRGSNRAGRPVWTRHPVVPAAGGAFDQQRSDRLVNSYRLPRPGWRSAREYPFPVVRRRQ